MKKIFHFSFCILLFNISNAKNLNTGIKKHPLLFTPVITSQPQDFYVCISGTAIFSVIANVTGSSLLDGLTYQWYANNILISGATSSSYSLTNVQTVNIGIPYKVIVSEYVLLNPVLTTPVSSNVAYINKPIVSTITLPSTQSIVTGNNVTLSVNAGNNTGFKWYKDGVFITGATSSSYNINPVATKDNGTYVLHAASGCGADIVSANSILHTDSILTSIAIGNFNSVSTWFNSAGTSNPLDFTRPEHIFKILSTKSFDTTKANFTIAGTLDIVNAATLITPSTTLTVGALIRSGTGSLSADSTSKLSVNGTSSLYFTTGKQQLNTLTITGGTTTLNTDLDIYGIAATPGSVIANGTLNTGGNLTLKSTAITTSSIGNSSGTISGTVTIERYIPPRRAWRLMTAPITATGAPSINSAWQEGATSSVSNINPGYGTHITGGLATAGFDRSPTNNSSLKYYNGTALVSVISTLTGAITDRTAYFIFIRGDRSVNIGASTPSTTATICNLRVTGNINQGPQSIPIAANTTYPLVGNPFASTVDWATIAAASASTNIADRYYMWDPQIGGTNQVGGYVLVSNVAGTYVFVPSTVTNVTPVLQSGQAVYVQLTSVGAAGTLTVNESAKLGTQSSVPFGRVAINNLNKVGEVVKTALNLAINLQVVNVDSSLSTVDGVLMTYN